MKRQKLHLVDIVECSYVSWPLHLNRSMGIFHSWTCTSISHYIEADRFDKTKCIEATQVCHCCWKAFILITTFCTRVCSLGLTSFGPHCAGGGEFQAADYICSSSTIINKCNPTQQHKLLTPPASERERTISKLAVRLV